MFIALKSMGDRFLSGYIALVDGEKDPRNLMIAFAIARVLALEFDISTKVEVRLTSLDHPFSLTSHIRTFSTLPFATSRLRFDRLQMTRMALLRRTSRAHFGRIRYPPG